MDNNKHLLYYWKDLDKNLREGKVGWLGTKNPGKKVFAEFNRLLPQSANSWLIAFRWEKSTNKTFPLAILKAIEHPVVRVDTDESYQEFIYYDPWQSYRLNRPTDSTRLAKFHELGSKIFHCFDKDAVSAGFVGANGIKPISDEEVEMLLANSKIFQRTELSVYVKSGSSLIAQSPSLTNPAKLDADEKHLENDSSPAVPDESFPDSAIGGKDWDSNPVTPEEANRRRQKQAENGELGELAAMRFEEQRLRKMDCPNIDQCLKHIAKSNTNAGFDILSEWNGESRYIEVKASENGGNDFFISENEVTRLTHFKSDGWLYFVDLSKRDAPNYGVTPLQDPGSKFEKDATLTPAQDSGVKIGVKIMLAPTQYRARRID
jgi:hypothetical protein